jgi:excinuclease ABC subunit B
MKSFSLTSTFSPTGDQPEAISQLLDNMKKGVDEQVLLGVTGSGKTFTMANVIAALNRPTLIISHNKTLAAQLYQEFRDFFPTNAVSYFVSYYDYYQPEAYVPQTDTYIEKETEINEEIDRLRLAATANLLTRPDTIVVASVSCIYNIGSPKEYGNVVVPIAKGAALPRKKLFSDLIALQYERATMGFHRGTFRVRGDTVDIFPAYENEAVRILFDDETVTALERRDTLTGKKLAELTSTFIFPAKHYMTDPTRYKDVFGQITKDMEAQVEQFTKAGKLLEAQRIRERVEHDLEMLGEVGYVNGIENYSRYFDGRAPGDPPYSLLEYFEEAAKKHFGSKDKWLLIVDESHMTIPQIRGMYNGDRARKQTLIDYGFRLPAALDNRPLRFEEFMRKIPQTLYVSATPDEWEVGRAQQSASAHKAAGVVEQLVRPTGLLDPAIEVRPVEGQVDDLTQEVIKRVAKGERTLVTTLTKQMAEDLTRFLSAKGVKVQYLHSDVLTLERSDILTQLRMGTYDVIVGVNLLREGLDLPEVALVAILDADKQGFLRSKTSLIQTMGRAARHIKGEVILYADAPTVAMDAAVAEVSRRREVQIAYNKKHGITPKGITKPIRSALVEKTQEEKDTGQTGAVTEEDLAAMTPQDKKVLVSRLKTRMRQAAREMDFEDAARLRDLIAKIEE